MKLGQHFLINKKIIEKIISYIDFSIRPLIEVGGGKGNLTNFLHPDLVIELDEKLVKFLPNAVLADGRYLPIARGQIVSSLPYYITYEFFEEISKIDGIKYLTLILQSDFAEKIKNESTYISYLVNFYYRIDIKDNIPPWFFSPKPKVYSTLVRFTRVRDFDERVNVLLKCVAKYKNKNISNALKLCNSEEKTGKTNKKVRDFKPWEVRELLNLMGINYV